MSREQNLELVKRGYEAFGRGDIESLLNECADDVEWIAPGPPELPTSGHRRGKARVAEFFRSVISLFEFHSFIPQTFVADGDRVIVLGTDEVTFRATGKRLPVLEWVHAFTIRNGKIVQFQEYFDASHIVAELGAAKQRT